MSAMTCDQVRAGAFEPGGLPRDWVRRPEISAHIGQCAACQDFLDAFSAGERAWATEAADVFTAEVVARTTGVDAVLADLPLLAEMDPGPGFTERVLMATSQKPAPEGWRARWAGVWSALVRRPRFAWEAAYIATVCWVLVFGNPVGAIEWTASNFGAVAREHLGGPANDFRADLETWRSRLAPEPASSAGAGAGQQAEATPAPVRAWDAATAWFQRVTEPVVDALRLAWGSVAGWIEWLAGQFGWSSTEPPADSARSPQ
jgi:hypothetical protein